MFCARSYYVNSLVKLTGFILVSSNVLEIYLVRSYSWRRGESLVEEGEKQVGAFLSGVWMVSTV